MIARSVAFVALLSLCATSASALTMKECSAKYNAAKAAAKAAGKPVDMKWNEFRKAECADATPAAAETKPAVKPAEPAKPAVEAAKPAATTTAGGAVFPKAVDPKYASQSAGKQRMHTCLDQYKVNKTTNGNGGMKWIMKGGGYYSMCNKAIQGKV